MILGLTARDGVGGKEVVQQIRMIEPNAEAVVFRAHTADPVFVDHQRYGFATAIKKPVEFDAFRALITQIVDAEAPASI